MTERELGMYAARPIGAAAVEVDAPDELGQRGVADGPCRGRTMALGIEAGLGHREDPAGEHDRVSLRGHHLDRREPPFGSLRSASSSEARRWMASSASSSRMRCLAAASSVRSADVRPGDFPAIDLILSSPDVDGLRADAQIPGQVGGPAAGCEQVEHALTELRWIPSSSHGCLLYATAA